MEIFGNFPSLNLGTREFSFHTPPIPPVVTETVTFSPVGLCSTLSTWIDLRLTSLLVTFVLLSAIVTQSLGTDLIASAPFRVIGTTPVNFVALVEEDVPSLIAVNCGASVCRAALIGAPMVAVYSPFSPSLPISLL